MLKKQIRYIYLTCLFSIIICFSSGCQKIEVDVTQEQEKFEEFIDEIFKMQVQNDTITLNYTLAEPEKYGIEPKEVTFGKYSFDSMKEDIVISENYKKRLEEFNYDALSKKQKVTFDILKDAFEAEKKYAPFLLYGEALGPTTGLQAQLPVILAEYNFYTKEDIKTYLELLPKITEYFQQVIEFEQEKSKQGLFMSDETADAIIKQCEDFIKNPEENYMIDVFNDRIDNYEGLTEEEKKEMKAENKKAVLNHVIPAYEELMKQLKKLKGTGTGNKGLCRLKNGREYYEQLVKNNTGSDKTIKEIDNSLDGTITKSSLAMSIIYNKDNDIFDKYANMKFSKTNPEEILEYLKDAVVTDFPPLEDVNCNIKYVHKSLQEHLSPAFYLTPAIDNFKENNIYINEGANEGIDRIFTTIAHEGYPGHLYQSVYYNQQNPNPLRCLLNFSGYSEGWATYVEMYSYHLAGLDENLASFAEENMIATLCLYAKVDIGINYHGWDMEKTKEYLKQFGIEDEETCKTVYQAMIDEPANYLKYTLGYIEFEELRSKAEKELGSKFNLKEFHKFLLDMGPSQFYIIEKYMDQWIKEQ